MACSSFSFFNVRVGTSFDVISMELFLAKLKFLTNSGLLSPVRSALFLTVAVCCALIFSIDMRCLLMCVALLLRGSVIECVLD